MCVCACMDVDVRVCMDMWVCGCMGVSKHAWYLHCSLYTCVFGYTFMIFLRKLFCLYYDTPIDYIYRCSVYNGISTMHA